MSRYLNADDILNQLNDADIVVSADVFNVMGKFQRCKTQDDEGHKQSATILVNEFPLDEGGWLLCGGYQNFKLHTDWQKFSIQAGISISKENRAEMRKQAAADRKRVESERKRNAEKAATAGAALFRDADQTACGDYLIAKMIDKPYGTARGKRGETLVRVSDVDGKTFGVQTILSKTQDAEAIKRMGRNKTFTKGVMKKAHMAMSNPIPSRGIVVLGEGVSTVLTIKMAMPEMTVVAAFDAGNLVSVAEAIHTRYPKVKILIAADDDFMCRCQHCKKQTPVDDENGALAPCKHCGKAHGKVNVGRNAAVKAANTVGPQAAVLLPRFECYDSKLSDFNDIITVEKRPLQAVKSQIEQGIAAHFPHVGAKAEPQAPAPAGAFMQGGGELPSLITVEDAVQRYTLVYGVKETLFDSLIGELVPKASMMDVLPEHAGRDWKTDPARKLVRIDEVGFDPAGRDSRIKCNMWMGWPTVPSSQGSCEKLLELGEYLCSGEDKPRELWRWVLKWLAYPIQHPGAKLHTALVVHGPQGAGKNLFFEAVMEIYGMYGGIIDQSAIEDKFNDWASKKLFMVADEVVAYGELFHLKNKLKCYVTGEYIRINPKQISAHRERNHMQLVFMSNETQPIVLENDDRRYAVIWTPEKANHQLYEDVGNELRHGGVAALHDYLLRLDLGDFVPQTKPPMTRAKKDLIELGKSSVERFYDYWVMVPSDERKHDASSVIDVEHVSGGIPICPVLSADIYLAYLKFCIINGINRPAPQHHMLSKLKKMPGMESGRKDYLLEGFDESVRYMGVFIFPPEHTQQPDTVSNNRTWLSPCVRIFRAGVEKWCGTDIRWASR